MKSDCVTQTKGQAPAHAVSCRQELSEEDIASIAAILRVLGDETRIRLIEVLNHQGRATVSALAAGLSMTQQNISRQLSILHLAGIVRRRREGRCVYYELADFTGWWLIGQLASGLSVG